MVQLTPNIAPAAGQGRRGLVRPVLLSAAFFMLATGLAYPLLTTAVAGVLFPSQANGSLLSAHGKAVGSAVIGQDFRRADYFHPRPSATLGPDPAAPEKSIDQPYNAASSGASNLGPTSKKLIDQVSARVRAYRQENALAADAPVPIDAVTASGSGLDPDISVANARLQVARVAKARQWPVEQLQALLERQTSGRQLGFLGEPRVNVLRLNLALDATSSAATTTR
jgi:K+-transporting ATPase ATPase C chain